MTTESLGLRLDNLERKLHQTRLACVGAGMLLVAALVAGLDNPPKAPTSQPATKEIVARQITIVDDQGTVRMILGQDPKNSQRRSRASGLTIFDAKGDERGGFGTMDDGSAVLALDAPVRVGNPMRDRVGMIVQGDGTAFLLLMDNDAQPAVRLVSNPDTGGGVQVFKTNKEKKKIDVRELRSDGDDKQTVDLNGNK